MVSPVPKPMVSKAPAQTMVKKSPFSGMDGRNSYDLDLVNDL